MKLRIVNRKNQFIDELGGHVTITQQIIAQTRKYRKKTNKTKLRSSSNQKSFFFQKVFAKSCRSELAKGDDCRL